MWYKYAVNAKNRIEHRITIVVSFHKLEGTEQFFNWTANLSAYPSMKVIVVVDSEEIDIIGEILKMKSDNFSVIAQKVGAPGLARNQAFSLIESEFVMFADSDDYVYLDSVERLMSKPHKSDLIIASYEKFDTFSSKIRKYRSPKNELELAIEPALWRMILKTSIVKQIEFTKYRMAEDQIFILEYLERCKLIESSGEVIYRYFTNQISQISRESSAIQELNSALAYLESNPCLLRTDIGSFVYVKLNLSLGLNGLKKLHSQRFPIKKMLGVLFCVAYMKMSHRYNSNFESHWSINA